MNKQPSAEMLSAFADIVGEQHVLTPADDLTRYTHENRDIFVGSTPLVLKPGDTREVAAIVRLANEHRVAIVPQGGHTGHAAGAVPDESGTQIVVSLERMTAVRSVDPQAGSAIVEAGMVLQSVQELADHHDRLFPLSLASEGSCQIGGNIGTNAGGTGVLAYGNTRDLILGLEVVTASGEIWDGLKRLKKDNTGYDLRDLFIGSEGTLGIITAAVVKFFPKPRGRAAAIAGMRTPEAALQLLQKGLDLAGKSLTGFEFMPRIGIETTVDTFPDIRDPLGGAHPWYVLMEISSGRSQEDAEELAEAILAGGIEAGNISDAILSQNETQRAAFWAIRENMPASQKSLGGSVKNDISVPVDRVPEFLTAAEKAVLAYLPDARIFAFGHMGDGNIHYNISQPTNEDSQTFLARRIEINDLVNEVVLAHEGSFSAEHGIGRLKRETLAATASPVEMEMMRGIKKALDPNNIMNPGKVV